MVLPLSTAIQRLAATLQKFQQPWNHFTAFYRLQFIALMGRQHCLGYPQQKENDSGMHLSSVTHLLDLVFSFQEQNNAMISISPDLESNCILQNQAIPWDVWHFYRQLTLCPPGNSCRTKSQESLPLPFWMWKQPTSKNSLLVAELCMFTSKHGWHFRPFIAVRAIRLSVLSTSFWMMNTRTSVPVLKGKVQQKESLSQL